MQTFPEEQSDSTLDREILKFYCSLCIGIETLLNEKRLRKNQQNLTTISHSGAIVNDDYVQYRSIYSL